MMSKQERADDVAHHGRAATIMKKMMYRCGRLFRGATTTK